MQRKRSLLDYFGASPSKRKQSDESSTTSGNVQSSTASSEYVSHASCSSTATNTEDTVASESSTEFSQCTNTGIPVTDIAAGPHQPPPVQPIVNFPSRIFGSKKRSFNCEWYKLYPWLEYSKEKDAAYCYPCRFFTISGSGKSDVAFTRNGFHDWKHAPGKRGSLQKHDKCRSHIEVVMSWNAHIQMKSSNSSVADMMDSARAQHVAKNVHYMKTIAEVILLCSQQEIGLRGHKESEDSLNRGNFLEILKLVALHDKTVQDRLQQRPRNGMYTSPEIQNSLLRVMGDMVRKMICDSVQQAGFFTLMADESKDCSPAKVQFMQYAAHLMQFWQPLKKLKMIMIERRPWRQGDFCCKSNVSNLCCPWLSLTDYCHVPKVSQMSYRALSLTLPRRLILYLP